MFKREDFLSYALRRTVEPTGRSVPRIGY